MKDLREVPDILFHSELFALATLADPHPRQLEHVLQC